MIKLFVACAVVVSFILVPESASRFSADDAWEANLGGSFSFRQGYRDFGSIGLETVDKAFLPGFAVSFGKRIPVVSWLRLRLAIPFETGRAEESETNSIPLEDGSVVTAKIYSRTLAIGFTPDIQIPFRFGTRRDLFISIGGGIHWHQLQEEEITTDNDLRIIDPYLVTSNNLAFSFHNGIGYEYFFSKKAGLGISNTIRFWRPVSYDEKRDLFPLKATKYQEWFLTDVVSFSFLLNY